MKTETFIIEYNNYSLEIVSDIREEGEDLIFFIHGLGCTRECFQEVWNYRLLEGYSIVCIDLPGFGDSPGNSLYPYGIEDHAEICREILQKYPGRKIHLIGHSMGGAVSLFLLDIFGENIVSFFNVEGNLFNTDCGISRSAVTSPSFDTFKRNLFSRLKYFDILKTDRGTRLWADWIEKSDPEAFNKSAFSLVQWSDSGILLEKFRELTCRKVYVCGEKNSKRKILRMISDIDRIIIPESGHFPMNDNPEEFYRKLADFINEPQ